MKRVMITAGAGGIGLGMVRIEAETLAKGMTDEAVRAGYAGGTALGRPTDPEDVALMALFLASDGARMVSGQALTVNGFTINPDP